MKKLNLTNKLSVFVLSTIILTFVILGYYFDLFLKNSDFNNNKKNILHIYERMVFHISEIENKLKKNVMIFKEDEEIVTSIDKINNFANNKNSAILLDKERQNIVNHLLEKVKISLNNDIVIYDKNDELVAYVIKKTMGYQLNYISYQNGKKILFSKYENDDTYMMRKYEHYNLGSFKHEVLYDIDKGTDYPPITYHLYDNEIYIKSHYHLLTEDKKSISGQIEIFYKCSEKFFKNFESDLNTLIFTSLENHYNNYAKNIFNLHKRNYKRFKIDQNDKNYIGSKYINTNNGKLYVVIQLDKAGLKIKLNENREKLFFILFVTIIIMIIVFRLLLSRILSTPLNTLMKQIDKIKNSDYSKSEYINSDDEIEVISNNINKLAFTIKIREADLKKTHENLIHLSNHDSLTDLPNRRLFSERLKHAIELANRSETEIAIIFLDLDEFKEVNDTLGHNVGDELLKLVAKRLSLNLRSADTIARVGGDEFHIMIENFKNLSDIENTLQKIIEDFSNPYFCGEHQINTSASIGVAIYPKDGIDSSTLIKNADLAMYQSKENGRDNFSFFSKELSEHLKNRIEWVNALKKAVESYDEFFLLYQPKISNQTGKIIAIEALIRWNSSKFGFINPDQFISLAEETKLIIPLGRWILNQACNDFVKLQNEGYELNHISINTSGIELSDSNMLESLNRVIKKTGIKANQIELEITESYVITNEQKAFEVLHSLRDMGIGLAIDDFGTGYSSLSYLQKFPVTRLKIDKSFVDNLPNSKKSAAVAKAIIALAKTFNLSITAEGVETIEQLNFLRDAKCDEIQGYFYSKPLSIEELKDYCNK